MRTGILVSAVIALCIGTGSVGFTYLHDLGVASAQPAPSDAGVDAAPTVPGLAHDPVAHPVEAATDAKGVLTQYGYVWGGMILAFALGTIFIKKADEDHWLSKDHMLPIGVALLGTLGAILQAKFAGGSWTVVGTTLMSAVLLVIQKPKKTTA